MRAWFVSTLCRVLSVVAAGTCVLVCSTPVARAQSAASDAAAAQAQYRKAHEAIKAKNWHEARKLLLELWARSQTYDVAASLGQVEYWLKNYATGARYVAFALRNIPPAEKPEMVDQLQAALEELKKKVGTVNVLVSRGGAEVLVDSQPVGTAPLPSDVYVEPGTHRFEARQGQGAYAEATLDAAAGQAYVVELSLQAAPVAPAPPASSAPSDDQPEPDRSASEERSMVPLYVAGSVAVVGLSTGIVLTVMAGNTSERIETLQTEVGDGGCSGPTQPSACNELADAASDRDTQRNLSYVSFAVAGAAVVGGAIYWLWPDNPPKRASVGVSWLPGGTFVSVRGAL